MKYFTNILAAMMILGLFSNASAASLDDADLSFSIQQSDTGTTDDGEKKKKEGEEEEPDC